MTLVDFYRDLGRHWTAAQIANPGRITYFSSLAMLMQPRLQAESAARAHHLDYFRAKIMANPSDLKYRLLGINAARRRELDETQKCAVRALEVEPDILTPLGDLRYEPSHTQLLSFFLDRTRSGAGADGRLQVFLHAAGVDDTYLLEVESAVVKAEHFTSQGRIDLRIELPSLLAFVEVKVDSGEGKEQLKRYRRALDAEGAGKVTSLVFLTLPLEETNATADTHIDFRGLLTAWLANVGDRQDSSSDFFARYLKSILMMLGITSGRAFPELPFAEQRRLLGLIETVGVEQ